MNELATGINIALVVKAAKGDTRSCATFEPDAIADIGNAETASRVVAVVISNIAHD